MLRSWAVLLLGVLLLASCGGGGVPENPLLTSGEDPPLPTAPPEDPPAEPPIPDLTILFVSGHQGLLDGAPSLSYLHESYGPKIVADLESSGYTVAVGYYADHPSETNAGGYVDLVSDMKLVRDEWVAGRASPTRVIVIAHSHGGVWATAAIREVPSLPIRLQVALDHSSYGWGTVGHTGHDAVMGGDPRDEYIINTSVSCSSDLGSWSDTSNEYDLEDVVFPNVVEALEVQSGQPVVFLEPYDEKWNARLDGSLTGLSCYWSNTTHNETREANGTTYPVVINWIRERLALD